ncbi:hypothetical protein FIBSPDRAFT_868824 [Athelia psychrophila]|uniref:Uncharacterized protein n=1 Tax=Athelia psychrophila TaxID=1759441 RepID=A0A166CSG0_9AGAM|nr:hypothetical protein FIBSPDRAFT_868824 [Fibularhizoctonia sp. CBS 109695]
MQLFKSTLFAALAFVAFAAAAPSTLGGPVDCSSPGAHCSGCPRGNCDAESNGQSSVRVKI